MRGILKKGPTLQEGMLESLELANGVVWLEKTLSGNRGQRGEEENSRLLRTYALCQVLWACLIEGVQQPRSGIILPFLKERS